MKIASFEDIKAAFDFGAAQHAITQAFIAHSAGKVNTPPVGYLSFKNPPGDMHLKYGHIEGDNVFVVKLATGFYENPKRGLPSSNGLMMVISAETGEPLMLLQDEGYLTDMRTAIAGAIATAALTPRDILSVGIIGTGIQARLQLECLHKLRPIDSTYVWGRSQASAEAYIKEMAAKGIHVTAANSPQHICDLANTIITTTPSTKPLLMENWIKNGTHITAVGADAPGKQELDANIFERATLTVCDSKQQCLHHGEMSYAQEHTFTDSNSMELGQLLADNSKFKRQKEDLTIADLTGIAAQDIAIAKSVWERLSA